MSRGRGSVPVFAFSPDPKVCARLALWWGVTAVHLDLANSLEASVTAMEDHLVRNHAAAAQDKLVIAGAYPFEAGVHTNFVKYHIVTRSN